VSGFDTRWLRRPPVWVEAAAARRTVSLVCTAFAPDPLQRVPYPWPYPTASYCCVIDGYNHEVARPQLVRLREGTTALTIAEQKYKVSQGRHGYTVYSPTGAALPLMPFHQPGDLLPLWLTALPALGPISPGCANLEHLRAIGSGVRRCISLSPIHPKAGPMTWAHSSESLAGLVVADRKGPGRRVHPPALDRGVALLWRGRSAGPGAPSGHPVLPAG
jgi:hypothetical protein